MTASSRVEAASPLHLAPAPQAHFGARSAEEWISLVRAVLLLSLIPALWFGVIRITHPAINGVVVLLGGYVILLAVGPRWIRVFQRTDLIIALDILVVTLVVGISGALNSPFIYLYYLTILEAAARLNVRQAITASLAMAGMIVLLGVRAGWGETAETAGFKLGAVIAGGFFLALFLGMYVQEYRASHERTWWGAQLDEAQARRTAELEAFYDLTMRLRAARNAEEMYPILIDHAIELLHADHGTLALLSPDRQMLTRSYSAGSIPDAVGETFPVAGSPAEYVIQTGTAFLAEDFAGVVPTPEGPARSLDLGAIVIVPLRSEQEIIGTVRLGRTQGDGNRAFTEGDVRLLEGIADLGGNAIRRARLFQTLEQSYLQMVLALARTMDARDTYTAGHSERIAGLAEIVARAMGCREDEVQEIRWGGLLHDIGKIGVPDEILRKPGPLTLAEQIVMRQHPIVGEGILASTERMRGVAKIVRHHQERWDGSGYPDGVRGDEIPLGARILAVVDAYSAIIDDRPYKKARSHEEAVSELRRGAGTQYDPRIVDIFCQRAVWTRMDQESGA